MDTESFRALLERNRNGGNGKATARNFPSHLLNPFQGLSAWVAHAERHARGMAEHHEREAEALEPLLRRHDGKRSKKASSRRAEYRRRQRRRQDAAAHHLALADVCHTVNALGQGRLDLMTLDPDDRADAVEVLRGIHYRFANLTASLYMNGFRATKATEDAIATSQSQVAGLISRLQI